ncbi:tellurite resistance TerB family protein [Flavobacterium nackdongense]|uniref:Excinuclease ABC subunit B n=1 Tax=Flavobacterium nackdongense TaxID=2547394 RepID=A0A4P6YH46_9FLAO|nr:excinuclease ABC subunit B [Flavobacterium nackdongense]QBN20157.1 excinuclease ABC subunit B [Flavobacterium nackdongense]
MQTNEEKISLLLEMIAFATIDGNLHPKEYAFLAIVAKELNISTEVFKDLFHQELPLLVIKSEYERFHQFYRLALLMHSDGVIHSKEEIAIIQIGIDMGLNPVVTNRMLKMMKMHSSPIIEADVLLEIFKEQHN